MSVTVNDIWEKVRVLIDEYTEDGNLIAESEVIDLKKKSIVLADMAQKELFRSADFYKTFEFLAKRPVNLLNSDFGVYDFKGEDVYLPNSSGINGAKAYYFMANGVGTAYIQEFNGSWVTLETIDINTTNTTEFKGVITPSDATLNIRLVFSGTSHYFYSNAALYELPYSTNKIPSFKPYYKVEMPSDFKSISQIVKETNSNGYERFDDYRWEGFRDLYININFEGNIRIQYKPVPTTLVSATDTLEIDDISAEAIPYYIAARLSPFEQTELVGFFEGKYEQVKASTYARQPSPIGQINDVYGGFDIG